MECYHLDITDIIEIKLLKRKNVKLIDPYNYMFSLFFGGMIETRNF